MRAGAKQYLFLGVALSCVLQGGGASGEEAAPSADALFKEAKALRDKGETEAACNRFSESYRLQPGVGAGLYLGDCYERLGRTASAWSAFREAERIAKERSDKRAAVAHKRAEALESHLPRLTITVDPALPDPAIALDGVALASASLKEPIPADPGDHVITLEVVGHPQVIARAHVDPDKEPPVVHLELPPAPPAPSAPPPPPPAVSAPPKADAVVPQATAMVPAPPRRSQPGDAIVSRRWLTLGLLGVGAAGIGTGAAFLALKNQSMTTGAPSGAPEVDERATATSIVAFSVGGAALLGAVVVFLTTPHSSGASGLTVAPTMYAGGEGLSVAGSF
jgi:hypothetical protein